MKTRGPAEAHCHSSGYGLPMKDQEEAGSGEQHAQQEGQKRATARSGSDGTQSEKREEHQTPVAVIEQDVPRKAHHRRGRRVQ